MPRLLTRCLLALFVTASFPAYSSELLAKADTRMPVIEHSPGESLVVSKVLVSKKKRRLDLMNGEEIVRSYRISLGDNPEGHKLYEGDERTPEGEYTLDWRNSGSSFYKSIHISYPSAKDREMAESWGLNPGGSIMIHGLPNGEEDMAFAYTGLDWTNGCIAVNNQEMDEIWQLVNDGTPIRITP
ncbi:MAG: L,D-transpeptidase family protein [Oleiphilaceae bacterium]